MKGVSALHRVLDGHSVEHRRALGRVPVLGRELELVHLGDLVDLGSALLR